MLLLSPTCLGVCSTRLLLSHNDQSLALESMSSLDHIGPVTTEVLWANVTIL